MKFWCNFAEIRDHPSFSQGWKEGEDLPSLMQGLHNLKYPEDCNFKCKKYRFRKKYMFAIVSYMEVLKAKKNCKLN